MELQTIVTLVLQACVFLMVFTIGLKSSSGDATYMLRHPGEFVRALISMNIIMPVFVIAVVLVVELNPAVEVALIAIAVSPIPPGLPNKLKKAGAKESYSIGLLVAVSFLAIITVPAAIEILARVFKLPLTMPISSVVTLILITVLIPICVGMVVRRFGPALAERIANPVSKIAIIGLLASVLMILIVAAPGIWTLIGNGTILALVGFVVVGRIVGYLLGGPTPENRQALSISTASRHPGLALAISQGNFPDQKLAMAAVLLYLLVDVVVSVALGRWMKGRAEESAEE
jgi:BASS family bile acid:Na+ symporter